MIARVTAPTETAHTGHRRVVGWLAAAATVCAAAAVGTATPARADTATDMFLRALENAGVPYGDPQRATTLGQSICPLLVRPGANLAGVAARLNQSGMSPEMARLFTGIAITLYCPRILSGA